MLRPHPMLPPCALAAVLLAAACGGGQDRGASSRASGAAGAGMLVPGPRLLPTWEHVTGTRGEHHLPEVMGSGAALFDADGDGDLDLYLTNGNEDPGRGTFGADGPRDAYFENDGGRRLLWATEEAGLGHRGYGMGVAVGDVDADGDEDLFVSNLGPDVFYANDGGARFADVTATAGLGDGGWGTSALFFDAEQDGDLDLYVARYVDYDPGKPCTHVSGRPDFCSPRAFAPSRDLYYENDGQGRFVERFEASFSGAAPAAGLGVACADLDGDGAVELYVTNDGYPNHLWRRDETGGWRERAVSSGCAYNLTGASEAGMGLVVADVDGDLDLDLFMTHLGDETHTLYENLGGGRGFRDGTVQAGLGHASLTATGFGAAALDLEPDGDLDLVVVNGRVTRGGLPGEGLEGLDEPNHVFVQRARRAGGGVRFELDTALAPAFSASRGLSRALCLGDLDRDGRLDLVVTRAGGEPETWLHAAGGAGRAIVVRPRERGGPRGRDAIGAQVVLVVDGLERALRGVDRGGSYLSSSPPEVGLTLPPEGRVELRVRWVGGTVESFEVPGSASSPLVLRRGEGRERP